ncbi:hypothetical protein NZ47_07325, partial [Anaerovibrio lipolyticus]
SLVVNVIIYLIILLFIALSGSYFGSKLIENYETDQIKREAVLIDTALTRYSTNHLGVNEDTLDIDEEQHKLLYHKISLFPLDLSELGKIRDEDNYFSEYIDLARWSYTTKWDSTGNMVYDLRSELPNGSTYHSPRSVP